MKRERQDNNKLKNYHIWTQFCHMANDIKSLIISHCLACLSSSLGVGATRSQ